MKTELSALLDGEIDDQEARLLVSAIRSDEVLRESWREYQLIGDALRGEPELSCDITARVMGELRDEPVVLAPLSRQPGTWRGSVLALAASLAGVAVVGWVAMSPRASNPEPLQVAQLERIAVPAAAAQDMQGYLVAHQAHAFGLQLHGGTQHIRTVAVAGMEQ